MPVAPVKYTLKPNKMKEEILLRLATLRAKLQPVSNREILEELIDIEIKLANS